VYRMRDIIDKILSGRASRDDLALLTSMAEPIMQASACALGKTAPTPVLATLKHFSDDYAKYLNK